MRHFLTTAAALAVLSACTVNNNAPADNGADANVASSDAGSDLTAPPADVANPPAGEDGNMSDGGGNMVTPPPGAAAIPAQYQGRWGMVPLDCTGDPAIAKGLITIDGKTIKFYEARATLKEQRPAIATSFSGVFDFTGEGQQWTKVETLTRTGDKLKRADEDGTYDYTRCR